jgi:glucose-6-phosphate dehydrogenase assembly protein OpcA
VKLVTLVAFIAPVAVIAVYAKKAYAGPAPQEPAFGQWIDPSEIPEDRIVFVAEGRIGNAAGVGAPTERELTLGRSTAAPEATADLAWANGSPWRSL